MLQTYLLDTVPELVPEDIKQRYPNDKTGQINTLLGKNPLLFDSYLTNAIEVDVDCLCDGTDVYRRRHHGAYRGSRHPFGRLAPARCRRARCPTRCVDELERQTKAHGQGAQCRRPDERAVRHQGRHDLRARSQPARLAHRALRRQDHRRADRQDRRPRHGRREARCDASPPTARSPIRATSKHIAVKEAVFPFARFPGVDILLGPEMRSTGEVMGLDTDFALAFAKSQLGAGVELPRDGTVFVSVRDEDKPRVLPAIRILVEHRLQGSGHRRHRTLPRRKRHRGRRRSTRCWKAVRISRTPSATARSSSSSTRPTATRRSRTPKSLRRATLMQKVPYYTTMAGAEAAAQAIKALKAGNLEVRPLQSYF